MANVKIGDLQGLTNPASIDVLPIVDVGTDTTKKVTIADLLENAGDGSASAPAFSFDNDKSVGMWRPGSEQLAFSTNATTRLFIDSAGKIGVGVSSPLHQLSVKSSNRLFNVHDDGETNYTTISSTNTSGSPVFLRFVGDRFHFARAVDGSDEKMVIDASGNMGLGTSSPSSNLEIENNGATTLRLTRTNSVSNYCLFEAAGSNSEQLKIETDPAGNGSGFILLKNGGTERLKINSFGRLSTFSSDGTAFIHTSIKAAGTSDRLLEGRHSSTGLDGGTKSIEIFTNGDVKNTNDAYGAISDVKLKENIVDANSQWDDFKAVRFRKYNFKEETGNETFTQLGVIAQELETVCPGLVTESPDLDEEGNDLGTTTKGVKYSILTKKALVALQEAMSRIETLEAEVAALKAQ